MKRLRRTKITIFRRRKTIVLRKGPEVSAEKSQGSWETTPETVPTALTNVIAPQKPQSKTGEKIMKTRNIAKMLLAAAGLTLGLLQLQPQTAAQTTKSGFDFRRNQIQETLPAKSQCKTIRGRGVQVFDPATGIVSGPVTNSGLLDGSLEDVIDFGAGFVFTPDPSVLTYLTDLTITTLHGQLKARPVTTQSVLTGIGNEFGSIDPDNSTGRFAGATGTIWVSFKPVGDPSVGPYEAEIAADICFAQ